MQRRVLIEKWTKPDNIGYFRGSIGYEEWLNRDGLKHRINGLPAAIYYGRSIHGIVITTIEEFWMNGIRNS